MRKSSVPEVDTEGIRNRIISETTLNLVWKEIEKIPSVLSCSSVGRGQSRSRKSENQIEV